VTQPSQQVLYEEIHDEYVRHLYDKTSNAYRDAFINSALFNGVDLDGKTMAEIMCGNGQATLYAKSRFPSLNCHGFDISRRACDDYTRSTGFPATVSDILTEPLPREAFDAIVVVGGFHHVVRELDAAMTNVHNALRPGGVLLMMEPNSDYVLESLRRIWYRADRYFDADDERALSYRTLHARYRDKFDERGVWHRGGPGYFLILMSMVFRIPLSAKRYFAPPLMVLETMWNLIPFRRAHAFFAAQWTKRDSSSDRVPRATP
jgi:SAM-dependent methyltransferase